MIQLPLRSFFFFFNDTATTEIYTLSLHDALPISTFFKRPGVAFLIQHDRVNENFFKIRSEEHTSELQSQSNLVCRLLLEKKKINNTKTAYLRLVILLYRLIVLQLDNIFICSDVQI